MKNLFKTLSLFLSLALICASFVACGDKEEAQNSSVTEQPEISTAATESNEEKALPDLWASATYTEDTSFGEGAKTVVVTVEADGYSIELTVNTDAETLGEALLAHKLIAGEESQYGLYIKTVNGILADYDVDGTYWGFYQNGEYMMSGVDTTIITGGEHFELVRTK
ncbi:MAG: DUF4430 domain-containing protein [Clostridia bacterium]|nr:DUF4430 domain-containing protein [Clostridia bacterium]